MSNKPLKIACSSTGTVIGVEIRTLDSHFVLSLNDEPGRYTFKEAFEKFNDSLPTRKQAAIIAAYFDDINNLLIDINGQPLTRAIWTRQYFQDENAWILTAPNGSLYPCVIFVKCRVRKILIYNPYKKT